MEEPLLHIEKLSVEFTTYGGKVKAVREVSFDVESGECVAIVGESGCGKSVSAKSILRLLPSPQSNISQDSKIVFNGEDILEYTERRMQKLRGNEISMIFQDPMTSLNPTMTIGKQISEVLVKHQKLSSEKAKKRTIQYLSLVGIANPEKRYKEYPDSLSGGMRQRVMIAIAMCCNPRLLIADEPTTALDVTVQAQILDLMRDLQRQYNTAIILITHDLGVVANMARRIMVFYAGQIVEEGKSEDLFYHPLHPYTHGLLKSMPRLNVVHKEDLISIDGTPPDLFTPPIGCAFAARCEYAMKLCVKRQPLSFETGNRHIVACWLFSDKMPKDLIPSWISRVPLK